MTWVINAQRDVVGWGMSHPLGALLVVVALFGIKYLAGTLAGTLSLKKGRR